MTTDRPAIRVLLVDDHALIRTGNALILDSTDDITVAGEAGSGEDAVTLAHGLRPDVVLMDVRMPGIGGIEATRRIVNSEPRTKVVVLTTFDLDEYAFNSLQAGASAFLLKSSTPEALTDAIRAVAAGDGVPDLDATRRLLNAHIPSLQGSAEPRPSPHPRDVISPREYDVFLAIAQGLSNPEISKKLTLSLPTIKTHVNRILAKLASIIHMVGSPA